MKKLFTLICAFVAFAGVANAASATDIAQCKHSYVLIMDDATNNGAAKPGKGILFGDGFFLDVTGGSVATNKGKANPCASTTAEDGTVTYTYGEAFAKKYADYAGDHLNSFRVKNGQDQFALNVTAGSKVIFLGQVHASRYPSIAAAQADNTGKNESIGKVITNTVSTNGYFEWQATDDGVIYVGSFGGDYYIGMVIVEANEAPGTPTVKVGAQTYENGLWFREVTCKANNCEDAGESVPTVVTYTTDGTTPTAASPVYSAPIKCYNDQTVKFQAYMDALGDGKPSEDFKCEGADNDGIVSFSFNAPTIAADGATFTVTSEYEGAKNYISYGDVTDKESNGETLTESATVTAYSKIVNGTYATFTTKTTTKDVYALNPIKEEKTIAVTAGTASVDEEATATSTTGTIYKIDGGVISADKADFFVKNLTFAALANADAAKAKYQVPAGQEAYIQMSNTNISFLIAEDDSVDVTVTCSKNSCKTINAENDESVTSDRKCYVNVDGTTYGTDDITNGDVANLDGYSNVINFRVGAGVHTFQKYSGTGNILISSINFKPVAASAIKNVNANASAKKTVKSLKNGQIVIETANGTFTAAGARVK